MPLTLLVCGGRDLTDSEYVEGRLDDFAAAHDVGCLIEGGARGADTLAHHWAITRSIPVTTYPADWATFGKASGSLRNQRMLDEGRPDFVIAFPTTSSRGTWDMVRRSESAGLPVLIYQQEKP